MGQTKWDDHQTKWVIFQQGMFDYQRRMKSKQESLVFNQPRHPKLSKLMFRMNMSDLTNQKIEWNLSVGLQEPGWFNHQCATENDQLVCWPTRTVDSATNDEHKKTQENNVHMAATVLGTRGNHRAAKVVATCVVTRNHHRKELLCLYIYIHSQCTVIYIFWICLGVHMDLKWICCKWLRIYWCIYSMGFTNLQLHHLLGGSSLRW